MQDDGNRNAKQGFYLKKKKKLAPPSPPAMEVWSLTGLPRKPLYLKIFNWKSILNDFLIKQIVLEKCGKLHKKFIVSLRGMRRNGQGNGNPLQYSYLGNPMDREAWRATLHGVTKESDRTRQLDNKQQETQTPFCRNNEKKKKTALENSNSVKEKIKGILCYVNYISIKLF